MSNESVECPLCMEPMDFDDVDFYPCPCRYQICRFCWYKIINEENGLCPACRKPYNSEHPASYKPRTEEEIKNKLKSTKKVCPKKGKPIQEGKEYLSEYRVLQKNLIFVVGLPMRMADEVELLKGTDYFGKCGKVYKIVINQNQTFPGPQGTSCLSAYVTYHRNEDALKTLIDLKKLEIDGRAVKLSLGTTKYCSQFLRNRKCTKQDCMYLHEMGDQAASFTKEDMANGKHTEYENQLIQEYNEIIKLLLMSNVSSSSSTSSASCASTTMTSSDCVTSSSQRKLSLSNSLAMTTGSNAAPTTSMTASATAPPQSTAAATSTGGTTASNNLNCPTIINNNTTKSQRPGLIQMTPIGTDPNDASKVYMGSTNETTSSNSKLLSVNSNTNIKQQHQSSSSFAANNLDHILGTTSHSVSNSGASLLSKDHYCHDILKDNNNVNDMLSNSLNSTSPLSSRVGDTAFFMNCLSPTAPSAASVGTVVNSTNSLLESFYQLNSQSNSVSNHHHQQQQQQQYEHNINQQMNNNGVLNYGSQYPSLSSPQQQQQHHYQQHQSQVMPSSAPPLPQSSSTLTPFRNDFNVTVNRLYGSEKIGSCGGSTGYDQKFRDNADIDFDPINISRKALEEMVALENRQKMGPGSVVNGNFISNNKLISSDSLYVGSASQQRPMLRPTASHEFMMQSAANDFFALNPRSGAGGGGGVQPSFIHENKPLPVETRLNQQMNSLSLLGAGGQGGGAGGAVGTGGAGGGSVVSGCNSGSIINSNTSSTVVGAQSISSGFPSPPPGFESTGTTAACLGDPSSNDIMTILMNQNNIDMYPRYSNQHSSPDLHIGMNHNQYSNQFQINYNCQNQISVGGNSFHSDFNYSNGGGGGAGGAGSNSLFYNDIHSQSLHGSHSWKNAQSAFIDGASDLSHHSGIRSTGYSRSHSMNDNSAPMRNSEWNGFSSFTSPNESSHLSGGGGGFQDGNFSMMSSMRVQNVQCGAPSNVTSNVPQFFSRQQTSHSVNH